MSTRSGFSVLLAVALAVSGCAPKPAAPAASAAATQAAALARSQQLIDAGNVAFKAGEFEVAAKRYAAASIQNPDDPAAFYGLGMSLAKLGRDEQARVAYAKARDLNHAQHPQ